MFTTKLKRQSLYRMILWKLVTHVKLALIKSVIFKMVAVALDRVLLSM